MRCRDPAPSKGGHPSACPVLGPSGRCARGFQRYAPACGPLSASLPLRRPPFGQPPPRSAFGASLGLARRVPLRAPRSALSGPRRRPSLGPGLRPFAASLRGALRRALRLGSSGRSPCWASASARSGFPLSPSLLLRPWPCALRAGARPSRLLLSARRRVGLPGRLAAFSAAAAALRALASLPPAAALWRRCAPPLCASAPRRLGLGLRPGAVLAPPSLRPWRAEPATLPAPAAPYTGAARPVFT